MLKQFCNRFTEVALPLFSKLASAIPDGLNDFRKIQVLDVLQTIAKNGSRIMFPQDGKGPIDDGNLASVVQFVATELCDAAKKDTKSSVKYTRAVLKFALGFLPRLSNHRESAAVLAKTGPGLTEAAAALATSPMAKASAPVKTASAQIAKQIAANAKIEGRTRKSSSDTTPKKVGTPDVKKTPKKSAGKHQAQSAGKAPRSSTKKKKKTMAS